MINLSVDEIAFSEKIDKERKQHAEAQKKYRNKKAHDGRTKKGKRQIAEIVPSFQTRKTELKDNTLKSYTSNSDIIHRILTGKSLFPELEEELLKLFTDEAFDEKNLIDNMDYLNDIEPTIETKRSIYSNNNSFK
jgi:hypothetical protein